MSATTAVSGALSRVRLVRVADDAPLSARVAGWSVGVLALLALWVLLFAFVLSGLSYQHAQHGLYADFREQLAGGVAPLGGPIAEGAPVALLDAPAIGLNGVVVVEGTTSTDLRSGPGHQPGAPLPGQAGVSVIMGRATSYGAPFARLTSPVPGERLTVTTGQGRFAYAVQDVRNPGDPFPPALTTGQGRLTLVTAAGTGWRQGWAPSHAVFVDARLLGRSVAVPGGVSVVTDADAPMASDTSGLYPMVLWGQLLVVGVALLVWLRRRWGAWQTWLVMTPVVLAALWGVTGDAWLLVPNLF